MGEIKVVEAIALDYFITRLSIFFNVSAQNFHKIPIEVYSNRPNFFWGTEWDIDFAFKRYRTKYIFDKDGHELEQLERIQNLIKENKEFTPHTEIEKEINFIIRLHNCYGEFGVDSAFRLLEIYDEHQGGMEWKCIGLVYVFAISKLLNNQKVFKDRFEKLGVKGALSGILKKLDKEWAI